MAKAQRVSVSKRAIIQRINRKLAHTQRLLRTCRRQSQGHRDLGDYYVVELSQNAIAGIDIDLETYGRELGVLADWETVVDE